MAFVDIFNFKKYITKPSDATTARIGHVNALYTDLKITSSAYAFDVIDGDLPITTQAGVITLADPITGNTSVSFNLESNIITENSVILITAGTSGPEYTLLSSVTTIPGSADITITNISQDDAADIKVNFLIIN